MQDSVSNQPTAITEHRLETMTAVKADTEKAGQISEPKGVHIRFWLRCVRWGDMRCYIKE